MFESFIKLLKQSGYSFAFGWRRDSVEMKQLFIFQYKLSPDLRQTIREVRKSHRRSESAFYEEPLTAAGVV